VERRRLRRQPIGHALDGVRHVHVSGLNASLCAAIAARLAPHPRRETSFPTPGNRA
jgi:hypothetical protein